LLYRIVLQLRIVLRAAAALGCWLRNPRCATHCWFQYNWPAFRVQFAQSTAHFQRFPWEKRPIIVQPAAAMMPLQLVLVVAPAAATQQLAELRASGPSPPAPAPAPGQWSPEKNLTFCNGRSLKTVNTVMPLAHCKALCAADPECFFINHAETDPGQCTTLASCTSAACDPTPRGGDPGNSWWSVYAYGRAGAPPYPGCNAPPPDPGPAVCPQYHGFHAKIDPAGPVQTSDGTWHVFSCCGWAHCTASDLVHWNCSHPSTGLQGNTGSITVTPTGTYAIWANNTAVLMATPNASDLDLWTQKGVIALPPAGDHQLSDVGRAMELNSGWYVPVGVRGPPGQGGGIHWYRADDSSMTHLTQKSWLFTDNSHAEDPDGEMSCPDVFELDGKVVILMSTGGAWDLHPKIYPSGWTQWFVGTISDNDLNFTVEHTGRIDYGAPGISSLFAGKTGTSMAPPFNRRVLFGFSGWSSAKASGCGQYYLMPRELAIDPASGMLQQRPVNELKTLRKAPVRAQYRRGHATPLAAGSQIEVLVECKMPSILPTSGVVAVNTLQTKDNTQSVQVGYEFGGVNGTSGFATVPPALAQGMENYNRTDRAPVPGAAVPGSTLQLNIFVDGDRVETFFGGTATITTVTGNTAPNSSLTSSFINTADLHCTVQSWVLEL
jgi:sucrose-6-phosphate hydrolase SacC (GH32 family)